MSLKLNIKEIIESGHSTKQAIAIAIATARKTKLEASVSDAAPIEAPQASSDPVAVLAAELTEAQKEAILMRKKKREFK